MIPVLAVIPKFSVLSCIILLLSASFLFISIFFLFRKRVGSVQNLKKDLTGYFIFVIIIITLLFVFGPFPVKTFGVAVAIGFVTAIFIGRKLCRDSGLDPNIMFDVFIYIFIGVIIGARVFFIIFYDWKNFIENPLTLFAFWEGGLVFYGGLIGGTLAGLFYAKKKRLNILKIADIMGAVIPIGIFFGRLGCLGYGCCFGKLAPEKFPFKLKFPAMGKMGTTPAFDEHLKQGLVTLQDKFSLPVYPAQIIDSLSGLGLFILLFIFYKKKKFDGQIASYFLMAYAVIRFLTECIRVEPSFLGISVSQWIGIMIFIVGLFLLNFSKKRALPQGE